MMRLALSGRPGRARATPAVYAAVGSLLLFPAGCATTLPPLWPFSHRTSEMASGIRNGFAGVDTLLHLAETPPADVARFRSLRTYTTSTLSAVTEYSRVLAELAGAGREGKDAAGAAADALGGMVSVAGAPAAAGVVTVAVSELAGAVAAARARTSLLEALRAGQPAVDTIAAALVSNLSELDEIAGAAAAEADRRAFSQHRALLDYHRSLTREATRIDEVLTLYLDARAGSADALAALRTLDAEAPAGLKDEKRFEAREGYWRVQARELDAELRRLQPAYSEYSLQTRRIASSAASARALLRAGQTAVAAWARAHARLPEALASGQQPSLVEFSAAAREVAEAARKGAMP